MTTTRFSAALNPNRRCVGWLQTHRTALPFVVLFTVPAAAETMRLADNDAVLSNWQQAAGTSQSATLIKQDDGGTRIEWKGGVSVDAYSTDATGGVLLNPASNGTFNTEQFQSDLRATTADGRLMYLQLSGMRSNDHSQQQNLFLLQSAQMGVAGKSYQVALGDVVPNFSALGTSLGVRGVLAQKRLGNTVVSASAGTLVSTWESLADPAKRSQFLRNVVATKVDMSLGATSRVFASFQGYADDPASLDGRLSPVAPAAGRTGTVGYAYQHDKLSVSSEFGYSVWSESHQVDQRDHAYLVDATYNGNGYTLWGGRHRLGAYYTSLSTQAAPGLIETYLGGTLQAASWLNLQSDVRRSENKLAAGTFINAVSTDGVNLAQAITFGGWQALSIMLNQTVSAGRNADDSSNRNSSYGGSLNYAKPVWNTALGYQHRLDQSNSLLASGKIDTWSWQLGRALTNDPVNSIWRADVQFTVSVQDQTLDVGDSTRALQYGFTASASHLGWGTLNASCTLANIEPTGSGAGLRNFQYILEASHPLKSGDSIKFYARDARLFSGNQALANSTRTLGMQLAVVF